MITVTNKTQLEKAVSKKKVLVEVQLYNSGCYITMQTTMKSLQNFFIGDNKIHLETIDDNQLIAHLEGESNND